MTEIVVHRSVGGFSLSIPAIKRFAEIKGFTPYFITEDWKCMEQNNITARFSDAVYRYVKDETEEDFIVATAPLDENNRIVKGSYLSMSSLERDDPALVQTVKELGNKVSNFGRIEVVEIPDDVEWDIRSLDDGYELIEEKHRYW